MTPHSTFRLVFPFVVAPAFVVATLIGSAATARADVVYLPCRSVDDCGPVHIPRCATCGTPDNGHPISN